MSKWIDRLCGIGGALFLVQFPGFYLQYLHQVEGHLAELSYHVSVLEKSALLSKKSLPDLVDKFLKNSDLDIARQGRLMQGILDRYAFFGGAEKELAEAPLLLKPFLFFRYFDAEIAKDTFQSFQPGIFFTFETFFYALLGAALGYALFWCFKTGLKRGIIDYAMKR